MGHGPGPDSSRAGRDVVLWARDPDTVQEIRSAQQNSKYLPGITFDEIINATTDLEDALHADAVLLVTPAQTARTMLQQIAKAGGFKGPLVLCAKASSNRPANSCRRC